MDLLKRRITIAINGTSYLSIPIVAIMAAILAVCAVCCCCLVLLTGTVLVTRSIGPTPFPTHHPSVTPPAASMLRTPGAGGTVISTVPFPTMTVTSSLASPTATSTNTPPPTPTASQTPTPPPLTLAPGQCPSVYTVQAGDTVFGIAKKCGLTVDDIVRANNLANSASLTIGQQLVLPGGGQVVTPQPAPASTRTPTLPPSSTPLPQLSPSPTVTPSAGPSQTPTSSPKPYTPTPGEGGTPTSTATPGEGGTPTSTSTPGEGGTPTSTATPGGDGTPTSTSTATPTPTPTDSGQAGECGVVDAGVSMADRTPVQNQIVHIFVVFECNGDTIEGAQMKSKWNFESGLQECNSTTDETGEAVCELNIGTATPGYFVRIDVSVTWEGNEYIYQGSQVGFTPQ